jgi:hypothetical protein
VPANARLKFHDEAGFPAPIASRDFPLHGYDAFPLGGVDSACFCSWNYNDVTGQCEIPHAVCVDKNLADNECFYVLGSVEGHAFTQALADDWTRNGSWECPENDFSDSWGIVPTDAVHDWIRATVDTDALTVNTADLVSFGLAGMRIGNMATLPDQARLEGVHPGQHSTTFRTHLIGLCSILTRAVFV